MTEKQTPATNCSLEHKPDTTKPCNEQKCGEDKPVRGEIHKIQQRINFNNEAHATKFSYFSNLEKKLTINMT